MRSLPKVIKASEYDSMKSNNNFPLNSGALQTENGRSASQKDDEIEDRSIVTQAFQKAQQIMEAAQNYSLNQVKEATQHMNEEAARVLVQSHEEGYSRGLTEGQKGGSKLGYTDGYAQGLKKAADECIVTMDELAHMIETVEVMKAEILRKYEADIENLAVAIAEKVIKSQLTIDSKIMQSIILNAMDIYTNQSWVKIYVSKNSKALLENADNSIIQALREISENVKIEASPEMNDGDCKIDMPNQLIDAGVDTQLAKIKQKIGL